MTASGLLVSAAILGGLGVSFGGLIALAHRKFRVWVDPRLTEVTERLPGTNCGSCGFAGCQAFAEGLLGGKAEPARCTVMGPEDVEDVAHYLGIDAGEAEQRVARLLCAGGCGVAVQDATYHGLSTCAAATAVAGGGKACAWGCLGLADCERSCDFDAIRMSAVGLPVVDPELCTACGDCVEACPKDLFVLMPVEQRLIVQCRCQLEGEDAERVCRVACTACGKCVMDAKPGVIEVRDGLAVVDYDRNTDTDPAAIARCPTGAIRWVEGAQFATVAVAPGVGDEGAER